MVISKKDRAFILLIISSIISLWFLFLLISYIFSVSLPKKTDIFEPITNISEQQKWFNSSRNLTKEDLKGRIILLDFWTYTCVKCLQNLEEIKKIERIFGDKLLVIGVHSGKFDNEKNPQSIKEAVLKYNINHPIINDSDLKIWQGFNIKSWPTLVLINPRGKIEDVYEGVGNSSKITKEVRQLLKKYRYILNPEPLPILLEKNQVTSNVLNFPSKIEYAKNFKYKNSNISALVISNSANNNIIISSLKGKILTKIGSKDAGFKDGNFKEARFKYPTGLLYKDDILYVADRGNHAIRKVDFKSKKVSTIIGNGARGLVMKDKQKASEVSLSLPQDLEYFPDKNHIAIANLGTNQILSYNIKDNIIEVLAGNGKRDLIDGKYPNNSLAQPSGLSAYKNDLYFVDSYSSSLRSVDKSSNVQTLIGQDLEKFGNKNGSKKDALMQNPTGLLASRFGIYVADSYNHLVRRYDVSSKKISNYSGNGVKANDIGEITSYNEVSDLTLIGNQFYILDSNNNRVVIKNKINGKTSLLDIIPTLRLPKDGLLEYLPNLEIIEDTLVKDNENITLFFKLSNGWKINEMAPSFFNLIEINSRNNADLIASYDWNMVKSGKIKLPKMSYKKKYYLQGTIYYCEDKKNSLCFIHSYEAKISPNKKSTRKEIKITL